MTASPAVSVVSEIWPMNSFPSPRAGESPASGLAKNEIVKGRFHGVVRFTNPPDWLRDSYEERKPKELAARMARIDAAQAEVYKLAAPVSRTWEVRQYERAVTTWELERYFELA